MSNHFLQFQREKTALKYFLIGRGYHIALKALGFVERYNVGLRKDGVTPSLHHEVQIALSVSQVKDVSKEELCIVAALLHDVQEDHQIPSQEIEKEFGHVVAEVVWKLTKKFAGTHKNKTEYINDIAMCEVASIVKGLDRVNNLHSMIGVFTLEKMTSYANEAEKVFLPMLKKAGKLFPEQQSAYHAISQQMKQAILFTRAYVKGLTDRDDIIAAKQDEANNYRAMVGSAEQTLKQIYDTVGCDTSIHALRSEIRRLREAVCTTKSNKEVFERALKAVLETCKHVNKPVREQVIEIKNIVEQLRKDFGISELEMHQYSTFGTEPIMPTR